MFTQVQLDNTNLAPVKCYLRDDTKEIIVKDPQEDSLDVNQNPFVAGSIVEDGELILRLWRDGRLAEYCGQCTSQSRQHCSHDKVQEVERTVSSINESGGRQQEVDGNHKHVSVTIEQKKAKLRSLCCFLT